MSAKLDFCPKTATIDVGEVIGLSLNNVEAPVLWYWKPLLFIKKECLS